jgi:hypothetical protein
MRAIRHSRRQAAVCRRPGAPAGTAQACGPAPAVQGKPLARASIAIRQAVSATAFRNHLLPAIVVVAMSALRPHGRAGAHDKPRYPPSHPEPLPGSPPYTTGLLATIERWSGCSGRGLDAGQPTLMPNEYFIRAHIYARPGILTHALSAFPVITVRPFPSFWSEIRSPNPYSRGQVAGIS